MTNPTPKLPAFCLKVLTGLIFILSICFVVGGVWNITVGGPFTYFLIGVSLLVTAILFSKRLAIGMAVYGILFIGVDIWTFHSVGVDLWRAIPRLDIFLALALLMFIPFVNRPLYPNLFAFVPAGLGTIGALVIILCGAFYDPMDLKGVLPNKLMHPLPQVSADVNNASWSSFGRTSYGDHFSPVDLVTPNNVSKLEKTWVTRTGDLPLSSDPVKLSNEATPISIDGQLYMCTAHQKLISINGETGEIKWTFDPQLDTHKSGEQLQCRGVSEVITPENALTSTGELAPAECPKRILLATNDARLFAINAETGERCGLFGDDGVVDLSLKSAAETKGGHFVPTSPPLVAGNIAVLNGSTDTHGEEQELSGITRAYDVYTGRLVWVFDGANPNPNEIPNGTQDHYHLKSPNSWSISSYDPELHLIYMPMGIGSKDQWGGSRDTDFERFAPGVVALSATSGHVVWSFRSVHHDLWGQDVPAQPVLMDLTDKDGITHKALYLATKSGDIFTLDRETGEPIVPIKELPVPTGAVKGDWTAASQPHSDLNITPRTTLNNASIWGVSLLDQMICSAHFHSLRYEGPWTPPSTQGSLIYPGDIGLLNWGGISIDPQKQTAFASITEIPSVMRLIKNNNYNDTLLQDQQKVGLDDAQGNKSLYQSVVSPFVNPLLNKIGFNIPCSAPPWGENVGIDLTQNKVSWRHRNGTVQDTFQEKMPLPAFQMGVQSIGGSLTTAGGITFAAGTKDNYLRAYNTQTGDLLWKARLPAGGQATPMTYEMNGRQFIVIYAGGNNSLGTQYGDYLMAYSLPKH